jgi:hypothetical protein
LTRPSPTRFLVTPRPRAPLCSSVLLRSTSPASPPLPPPFLPVPVRLSASLALTPSPLAPSIRVSLLREGPYRQPLITRP